MMDIAFSREEQPSMIIASIRDVDDYPKIGERVRHFIYKVNQNATWGELFDLEKKGVPGCHQKVLEGIVIDVIHDYSMFKKKIKHLVYIIIKKE